MASSSCKELPLPQREALALLHDNYFFKRQVRPSAFSSSCTSSSIEAGTALKFYFLFSLLFIRQVRPTQHLHTTGQPPPPPRVLGFLRFPSWHLAGEPEPLDTEQVP